MNRPQKGMRGCSRLWGVKEIIPVDDVNTALSLKKEGYVLFGENNLNPIEGFQYGNSPTQTMKLDLDGVKAVLMTMFEVALNMSATTGTPYMFLMYLPSVILIIVSFPDLS